MSRLKYLCIDAGQYGLNVSAQDYSPTGHRLIRTSDIDENGRLASRDDAVYVNVPLESRHEIRKGDLLLSRSGTIGRAMLLGELDEPSTYAGYLVRFRPGPGTDPRFMAYMAASSGFQAAIEADAVTSTIQNFNAERYANIALAVPPLDEQRRIADFLDAETAGIDAIAVRRAAQTASLGELALALVGRHLSGADVSGPRRATGWTWLPSIPEDWFTGPVYAYFDVQLGKMLNSERASGNDQQNYLRNANVHWYDVDIEDLATMTFEPHEWRRYGLLAGDLLVCEGGAGVAEAAVWDARVSPCFYQKSLHRVRSIGKVPVEWLMYWLRFAKAVGVFRADGNLATIPHLTGEQLAEYRIPVPPDGSQRVARLAAEIETIRKTLAQIALADTVLAERRQALITAAVTGQIDVTTARGAVSLGGGVG
jgi:type I restriction enzyme, S subunit